MAKGGLTPSGKREVKFTERNSEAELTAGSLGSRRPVFPIGAPGGKGEQPQPCARSGSGPAFPEAKPREKTGQVKPSPRRHDVAKYTRRDQ